MVGYTTLLMIIVGILIVSVCGVYYGDTRLFELQKISPVTPEVQHEINTYAFGVTISKVAIVFSVASIVFLMFQGGAFYGVSYSRSDYESAESYRPSNDRGVKFMSPEEVQQRRSPPPILKRRPRPKPPGFEASPQHTYAQPYVDEIYVYKPDRFDEVLTYLMEVD
jgi:hypothetical protein